MRIATIDTGTTNTRIRLWDNRTLAANGSAAAGVRNTALSGSTATLKSGVRQALLDALSAAAWSESDLELVLAAGMITSNMGLWELPHLAAPAGIADLAAGMQSALLPDVTMQPIWFIPGVKNSAGPVNLENCDQADMMRGEEVETYGLTSQLGFSGPVIVVLPGSHTKFVWLDENNRIAGSITTIAGELLSAITNNTLIANALNKLFAAELDPDSLLAGAKHGRQVGLGRACFQVRLLDLFAGMSYNQKANFLLGAVLANDLAALDNSAAVPQAADLPLIVGGGSVMAEGLALLLKANGRSVRLADAALLRTASGVGCLTIAAERGLLR